MRKIIVVLFLFVFALLYSCSNDSNPVSGGFNTTDLTSGYTKVWKMSSYFVNGIRIEIPIWAQDNVLILNKDGTGSLWFGEIRKDASDSIKVDDITWTLNGSTLRMEGLHIIHDPDGDGIRIGTLIDLSQSVNRYKYTDHLNQTIETWYQPFSYPNPNPSQKNTMLTHGYSKIWKIDSVWADGVVQNIPEWRKDDYFLYNSDGTGLFTSGILQQYPNDTTTNDLFRWGFAQYETKIDIEEFEHGYLVVSDCDIVRLNENEFVYEGMFFWEGQLKLWRMKRIPLLK
jgi:hypothetical protein